MRKGPKDPYLHSLVLMSMNGKGRKIWAFYKVLLQKIFNPNLRADGGRNAVQRYVLNYVHFCNSYNTTWPAVQSKQSPPQGKTR